jgi:thiamine-monophosphate kinase
MKEFEIIKKYFANQPQFLENVITDIGDDAAIVCVPHGQQLVVTTDTLIQGVHFPKETAAYDIGYKSLAVNLSDLAAMGAKPAWVTLALTLPHSDEKWIQEFTRGFFDLANRFQIKLIGGDTTQGPMSITVQAMGLVTYPETLLRQNAEPGDLVFVSNTLGDAGVGLNIVLQKINIDKKHQAFFLEKLNRPEPQTRLGEKLHGISRCAIDISDGLVSDLNHILTASGVGAEIDIDKIPLSPAMRACIKENEAVKYALASGDDYALCFTVKENIAKQHEALLKEFHCTSIGVITEKKDLRLLHKGKPYTENLHGYQHFE